MAELLKVLVVDDDRTWQSFLAASLEGGFEVKVASNGDEADTLVREWIPDCILLDIEMPGKNGYEVCREIKANPLVDDIPVIFLSSKSSLQEKIRGFEMGAEDYLVKPCEAELLTAKVNRAVNQYHEKKSLDAKAAAAQVAAFEALSSSADLGRSLRFVERTYTMNSFDRLAEGLFQTMDEFGLQTSIMFVSANGPLFYSHNTVEISPLEKEMFIATHQEGRFCDFGNRTFCNFKLASLLVKNMPLEHPERYGRIKDTIPWILGATDGKVTSLDKQQLLLEQEEGIERLLEDVLHRFSSLTHEIQSAPNNASAFDKSLGEMAELLHHVIAQHERILHQLREGDSAQSTELGADEIFSSDVDFF